MVLTTEEFVVAFHSLNGFTIGEKRRNLFLTLHENQDSSLDLSDININNLSEDNLKFEVLNYYRNYGGILKMLQEENVIVIKKIVKLDWFIKEVFTNMDAAFLISELFPNLSFNSKLKLLNRFAIVIENPLKGDEYFSALKESYGLYLASKLLPMCSINLILETIENNKVEITPKQLLLIIKRNPSSTEKLFENLYYYNASTDHYLGTKYKTVFKYLMQNDPQMFLCLSKKYSQQFQLGSRSTKKFVRNNKELCLNNSEQLHKLLKESQIVKYLNKDFHQFFTNVFPKSLQELINNFEGTLTFLKGLRDEEKLNLLLDTFTKHYSGNLLDYHNFIVPKVLSWMSIKDKDEWLEANSRPTEISEEAWISFMRIDRSIDLIKSKLSSTSNLEVREKLVKALVTTCQVNNDMSELANICEYMAVKSRNDHIKIRHAFLDAVYNSFDLKKLEICHWNPLNQMVRMLSLNGEYFAYNYFYIEAYIRFCLKNNLPATEIIEYLKLWLTPYYYSYYSLFNTEPKYKKLCLELFPDVFPLCFEKEELETSYVSFLNFICKWNQQHRKDQIPPFQYKELIELVKINYTKLSRNYETVNVLLQLILIDTDKAFEMNLLNVLFEHIEGTYFNVNDRKFISNRFMADEKYLNSILKDVLKYFRPRTKQSQIFNNALSPKIVGNISEIWKREIKESKKVDAKSRALLMLSLVEAPNVFLEFIKEYYPTDTKINIEDFEKHDAYKLQKTVPQCFQNLIPSYLVVNPILNFCNSDYMRVTRNSLFHIMNNVAEKRLIPILSQLATRAVVVKKYSVSLALRLLDYEGAQTMLKDFMENETNSSMRSSIFISVLNFFFRNPNDRTWQLVKESFKVIHANDTEAYIQLANAKRAPKTFFVEYILFAWNMLKKAPTNKNIEESKCVLLKTILPNNITLLPTEFCEDIISNYLLQTANDNLEKEVNAFVTKYLIYGEYNAVDEVFLMMKKYSQSTCKSVFRFVESFATFFIEQKPKKDVLNNFSNLWNNMLEPYEALEEYLYIHLALGYLDSLETKSAFKFGSKIAQISTSLFEKGYFVVNIIKEIFENKFKHYLLSNLKGDQDENYLIIIQSISNAGNIACTILALVLMPREIILTTKTKVIYESIIENATNMSDPMVKIHLHSFLINKN
ncbi:hypothetical protein FQA39_LY17375 [Lamprigera yunnana]|nr:hypothetical protein FQA39_LY17375 [Lamprigera yunnana]